MTSALDAENEAKMYRLIQDLPDTAYVSVGHRMSLVEFTIECVQAGFHVAHPRGERLREGTRTRVTPRRRVNDFMIFLRNEPTHSDLTTFVRLGVDGTLPR